MQYTVTFYNSKLMGDIERWPSGILAKFARIVDLLSMHGLEVGMPLTKAMGDGLFEIRAKGREGIGRAFFCTLVDKEIVILHGFIKKTYKTPAKEMEIARKRKREVKNEREKTNV